MEKKEEKVVVGVPVGVYYGGENEYQRGMIPPNAVFGDPKGIPSSRLFTGTLLLLSTALTAVTPLSLPSDDIVLTDGTKDGVNRKLELWRNTLESKGLTLSRNKTEYMKCEFSLIRDDDQDPMHLLGQEIKAQSGSICWMPNADDAQSLLSLPFNGLPLA